VKIRTQKILIKYNSNEELIINGIPDKKKLAKLMPIIGILENSNMILDFFSHRLVSSLFIKPIIYKNI
jgi:hypothetical protein